VVVTSSSTKRQDMIIAARLAAEKVRASLAVEFAAGLISRHPGRLDDIKHALTVDQSEHKNGLLGIVSERDLDRAAVFILGASLRTLTAPRKGKS
jgi:hypothetical protein